MKANSGLVASILALCAVTCVADIPPEKYNGDVAREFAEALLPEASELLADLMGAADSMKEAVVLGAGDPLWTICGFCNMVEDERMIFRRLYRYYGNREVALTQDALVVSPRSRNVAVRTAPVAPVSQVANVVTFKMSPEPDAGEIASVKETVKWLVNADLSGIAPSKADDLQTA